MAYGQPFYMYPNSGYAPSQAQNYNMYNAQNQMPTMQPAMSQNQPINNNFQSQPQMPAQQAMIPPKTNVPLATSLIDAMSRNAEFNTDTFYADQDKPFIYRVSIDMQGRKTYRTFELKDVTDQVVEQGNQAPTANIDLSDYATKADLQAFRDEIIGYAMSLGVQAPAQQNMAQPTSKPKKSVAKDIEDKE